jgi:hypothetical protein
MKLSTLSLLPLLAIAAACGGSGSGDSVSSTAPPTTGFTGGPAVLSNQTILSKVYDNEYFVPDHFFVDERVASTTRSYTVHHVLDVSKSYEVCTDNMSAALALEAADNDSRSVSGYFVNSYENERYYEIVRELSFDAGVGNVADPTSPGYARVFKCRHTNRDGVDRALLDGYSGALASNGLDAIILGEFTEYLWQFRFFNVSRRIVLDSYSEAAMTHTLLLAFRINQGSGNCDRIDLVEWRFQADPQTGSVSKEFDVVRSFRASVSDGVPQICQ